MSKGILLAGNESSLFTALGREASLRVKNYAAAPISSNTVKQAAPKRDDNELLLEWNPASPVSARTLVLAAQNRLEQIDTALLVCVPPPYNHMPEELSHTEIDSFIDNNIKSWFFLVKELAAIFKSRGQGSGTLALVLSEVGAGSRSDVPDLPGSAVTAAFRAFAQGILAASQNAPYDVLGFSSAEPGEDTAFAAHVFKILDEEKKNAGKWHKYGKMGIFGR
jgi:NAD(P)-dependent dehydrogenase (short-subunit alcohol dehydrogenase family)